MPPLPFYVRRPWLLAQGMTTDRERPPLDSLGALEDPEGFVWAILPHAARTFAPSILLLPEQEARAAAVAYLYARMLDTYEDLSETPTEARHALHVFASRFGTELAESAPALPRGPIRDDRDRAHLLLVDRYRLVDQVFAVLDEVTRSRIARLIGDMATGMIEFSSVFEEQGGVLVSAEQVVSYCHRVIGLPAIFVMELLLGEVSDAHRRDALEVAELVQLANITRDVEKDLRRGIAYHPALRPHLGSDGGGAAADDVARARFELMTVAVRRAPAFRRLVLASDLPLLSPARAAAVLMGMFTERHYRAFAPALGPSAGPRLKGMPVMLMASIPAAFSPRWANRVLARVEQSLLATT